METPGDDFDMEFCEICGAEFTLPELIVHAEVCRQVIACPKNCGRMLVAGKSTRHISQCQVKRPRKMKTEEKMESSERGAKRVDHDKVDSRNESEVKKRRRRPREEPSTKGKERATPCTPENNRQADSGSCVVYRKETVEIHMTGGSYAAAAAMRPSEEAVLGARGRPPSYKRSDDSETESENENGPEIPAAVPGTIDFASFQTIFDASCILGWGGRSKLETGAKQKRVEKRQLMYGSVMPSAVQKLTDALSIGPGDSFFDIGSGIGQVVLQVALCTGATSKGVELDEEWQSKALRLWQIMHKQLINEGHAEAAESINPKSTPAGRVELLSGCFTFCEEQIKDSSIIFFNNANGHFSGARASGDLKSSNLERSLVDILKKGNRSGQKLVTIDTIAEVPEGWKYLPILQSNGEYKDVPTVKHVECLRADLGERATSWTENVTFHIYTLQPKSICSRCNLLIENYDEDCSLCEIRSRPQRKIHV